MSSDYANFFLASTTVAGALTGLLFVALSVAPQRLTGPNASVEHQAIAATAFTALTNSLWISLFAQLPSTTGDEIKVACIVLGALALSSTIGLTVRLWRARAREKLSGRWPFLLPAISVLYAYQISVGFTASGQEQALGTGSTMVLIFFGVGLIRSWELLGLRGGGLLDLLATAALASRHDAEDKADRPAAEAQPGEPPAGS